VTGEVAVRAPVTWSAKTLSDRPAGLKIFALKNECKAQKTVCLHRLRLQPLRQRGSKCKTRGKYSSLVRTSITGASLRVSGVEKWMRRQAKVRRQRLIEPRTGGQRGVW